MSPDEVVANAESTLPARLFAILVQCRIAGVKQPPRAFRNKLMGPEGHISLYEGRHLKVVTRVQGVSQAIATSIFGDSVEEVWRALERIGIDVPVPWDKG